MLRDDIFDELAGTFEGNGLGDFAVGLGWHGDGFDDGGTGILDLARRVGVRVELEGDALADVCDVDDAGCSGGLVFLPVVLRGEGEGFALNEGFVPLQFVRQGISSVLEPSLISMMPSMPLIICPAAIVTLERQVRKGG